MTWSPGKLTNGRRCARHHGRRSNTNLEMSRYLPTVFASLFFVISVIDAHSAPSIEIDAATSPDGNYRLEGVADSDETCRVDVKSLRDKKVVGKIAVEGFLAEDTRHHIRALWKEDSKAFALQINRGRNLTDSQVFVEDLGSWKETKMPGKELDRVRKEANDPDGKSQEYLSVSKWLPKDRIDFSYQGNSGEEYHLIYRLVRSGKKPRLAFVETVAPAAEPEASYDYEDYTFAVLAGGTKGSEGGVGTAAQFTWPRGVAVDADGNVFVADKGNHVIRKIAPSGVVSTLAGSSGNYGCVDDIGAAARFRGPMGMALDAAKNIYIADSDNQVIRKLAPDGRVTTLAGSPGVEGYADGTGAAAKFHYPTAVALDKGGNVYVADSNNRVIRKITPAGVVTTVAGIPGSWIATDGDGKSARFDAPFGVAADGEGNVYVSDKMSIRKIDAHGMVSTLAGAAEEIGTTDGSGTAARFQNPIAVTADSKGNVYVADNGNKNIRKITPAAVVKTLRDPRRDASFNRPVAVAVDDKGHIYVADEGAFSIIAGKPAK